jgi:tyrosyl-tRNA synthetase
MDEIKAMREAMTDSSLNPRDAKIKLAYEIISMYHDAEAAKKAEDRFKLVFSQGSIPHDIPEVDVNEEQVWLPKFLHDCDLVSSTSEGRRMLQQEAVRVNGEKHCEENLLIQDNMVIQVGKRKFVRIKRP